MSRLAACYVALLHPADEKKVSLVLGSGQIDSSEHHRLRAREHPSVNWPSINRTDTDFRVYIQDAGSLRTGGAPSVGEGHGTTEITVTSPHSIDPDGP